MSLFNRKTALDDGIESYGVYAIGDFFTGGDLSPANLIYGADKAGEAGIEAAKLSAEATLEAQEKNIEFQRWLWGEQREGFQPYMDAGERALDKYEMLADGEFTLDDMYKDPGYQFRFDEGKKAYENSASAKGMQLSGKQAKDLTRFGQEFGSHEYAKAYGRRQTNLDNLYRMIASGQASAAGTATTGTAMGSQVSSAISAGGQSLSDMYQDIGNVQAAQAQAGGQVATDAAGLILSFI